MSSASQLAFVDGFLAVVVETLILGWIVGAGGTCDMFSNSHIMLAQKSAGGGTGCLCNWHLKVPESVEALCQIIPDVKVWEISQEFSDISGNIQTADSESKFSTLKTDILSTTHTQGVGNKIRET